jgi:hypothetical protein
LTVRTVQPFASAAEAAAPHAEDEIVVPGINIDGPTDGAAVASRLVVRGRRTAAAPAGLPLWLVVRADVDGGRWYALDRPLDVRPDGSWDATIDLGGPAGVRHEIRVGPADDDALRRHAREQPGQPLDDLPPGFQTGARVVVQRR